ncbi:ABC transporter permease [Pseudonocardia alni]|uniref:ABC transporter permease n=1 Tax=Pseudonocardia alni TaxID=33907 RepID=UPI0033C60F24
MSAPTTTRPGPSGLLARRRERDTSRTVFTAVGQILAVLVGLVIAFGVADPEAFLSVANFRSIAQNVAILTVLGVGVTFVIITSGIDLSLGSVLVFSSIVAAKAMDLAGGQGAVAAVVGVVAAVAAGLGWGAVNGLLVTVTSVPPLIATLGTMGAALGLSQVITGGVDIRVSNDLLTQVIGYGNVVGQLPVLVVIAAVVVVLGAFVLHRTRFGKYTYAVGSNAEGARRAGIAVNAHLVKVYMLCGGLAGLAGILSVAFFQTTTIAGQTNTALNVIAGVVIGGTSLFGGVGTVVGTVIGLCIPAVLQSGFVIIGVQPYWQQVVVGAVLVAAVIIDQRRRARRTGRGTPARRWRRRAGTAFTGQDAGPAS